MQPLSPKKFYSSFWKKHLQRTIRQDTVCYVTLAKWDFDFQEMLKHDCVAAYYYAHETGRLTYMDLVETVFKIVHCVVREGARGCFSRSERSQLKKTVNGLYRLVEAYYYGKNSAKEVVTTEFKSLTECIANIEVCKVRNKALGQLLRSVDNRSLQVYSAGHCITVLCDYVFFLGTSYPNFNKRVTRFDWSSHFNDDYRYIYGLFRYANKAGISNRVIARYVAKLGFKAGC